MDCLDGVCVRRLRQAERRLALFVEPVGEEADTELALDLEVLEVRGRGVLRRQAGELVAIHVERHTDRMTLEASPSNGRPVGWTFRDIGESSVVVDADDRGHLRLELDRLGVHRTGEGPYTIELNGRTTHATIKSIDTPLTLIGRCHQASRTPTRAGGR